mmetsp:Transcript_31456/g.83810  ORF Transcript_31456/g.83810 Transcript_31456/m.83810 type:complete len:218 (-) Transcript_31456:195-848(-)
MNTIGGDVALSHPSRSLAEIDHHGTFETDVGCKKLPPLGFLGHLIEHDFPHHSGSAERQHRALREARHLRCNTQPPRRFEDAELGSWQLAHRLPRSSDGRPRCAWRLSFHQHRTPQTAVLACLATDTAQPRWKCAHLRGLRLQHTGGTLLKGRDLHTPHGLTTLGEGRSRDPWPETCACLGRAWKAHEDDGLEFDLVSPPLAKRQLRLLCQARATLQ